MCKLKNFLGIYSFSSFLRIPRTRFAVREQLYVIGYFVGSSFRKVYTSCNLQNAYELLDTCKEAHKSNECALLEVTHNLFRVK